MAHRDVRRLLQDKAGWDRRALSAQVRRLKAITPMSTDTAQAVLAHQHNIRLDRHLEPEALSLVQNVLPLVSDGAGTRASRPRSNGSGRARPAAAAPRPIVFPDLFEYTDPILPTKRVQEAREMATVYPMLYVLENSVRELIKRVMAARYGPDWWETALTSARAKAVKVKADSRRLGENSRRWHQRRGADPLDYTDLGDLKDLILAKRAEFAEVLGGEPAIQWIEHNLMLELEPSRNVVCHMNPLDPHNVDVVRMRLRGWRSLVEGRAGHIPT